MLFDIDVPKPKFIRPKILLHPNIPKPLHGVNPRTVLGRKWWDEQRQVAYKKNNYCCWACGTHKSIAKYRDWLEAHEAYRINYRKGTMRLIEIVALCHSCHNYIHSGRLKMLLDNNEISSEKYYDIMAHGDAILNRHRLERKEYSGRTAKWEDWRLIIDKKKYKPLYKNYDEWYNHYMKKVNNG